MTSIGHGETDLNQLQVDKTPIGDEVPPLQGISQQILKIKRIEKYKKT